jgi:hypothetical protein
MPTEAEIFRAFQDLKSIPFKDRGAAYREYKTLKESIRLELAARGLANADDIARSQALAEMKKKYPALGVAIEAAPEPVPKVPRGQKRPVKSAEKPTAPVAPKVDVTDVSRAKVAEVDEQLAQRERDRVEADRQRRHDVHAARGLLIARAGSSNNVAEWAMWAMNEASAARGPNGECCYDVVSNPPGRGAIEFLEMAVARDAAFLARFAKLTGNDAGDDDTVKYERKSIESLRARLAEVDAEIALNGDDAYG